MQEFETSKGKGRSDRPIQEYLLSETTVKISVGSCEQQKTWFLNEQLLCAYSPFFKSVLQGNFTESLSKHLVLEEDDPEGFGDMIEWLYAGKLPTVSLYNEMEPLKNLGYQRYRLNILAHQRFVSELENETMIQIRSCLQNGKWPPSPDEISLVYENSDHTSEIRSLLVECQTKA